MKGLVWTKVWFGFDRSSYLKSAILRLSGGFRQPGVLPSLPANFSSCISERDCYEQ